DNHEVKSIYEADGYMTDPGFFHLFSYHFIEGNPATALNNPRSLVLPAEIAKKLFGDKPVLNKLVHINSSTNGEYDYIVTGIFEPIGLPSHINARFCMSIEGGDMAQYIKTHATDFASNNM